MQKKKVISITRGLCIVFVVMGIIFFYLGFDKKNNYNNPDSEYTYGSDYVNSYVGGDAYNYIINGTYFTAYAVMGTGSMIIASIFGITGMVLSIKSDEKHSDEEKLPEI